MAAVPGGSGSEALEAVLKTEVEEDTRVDAGGRILVTRSAEVAAVTTVVATAGVVRGKGSVNAGGGRGGVSRGAVSWGRGEAVTWADAGASFVLTGDS